ncbi:MAG: hypothetical protein LIP77_07735 [Planctomycetes bacterium]|nr:hypothetical protein [Planctomycetota bacterium]
MPIDGINGIDGIDGTHRVYQPSPSAIASAIAGQQIAAELATPPRPQVTDSVQISAVAAAMAARYQAERSDGAAARVEEHQDPQAVLADKQALFEELMHQAAVESGYHGPVTQTTGFAVYQVMGVGRTYNQDTEDGCPVPFPGTHPRGRWWNRQKWSPTRPI